MPLYEYTCQICSNAFERLRPIGQMDDPTNCPDCGGRSDRQLSVFSSFSLSAGGERTAIAGGGGGCCGGSSGGGCACSMTV
jgi:putative FmdB family regulatory protein